LAVFDDCHNSNYDDCKFKDQFGEWQGRTMVEVPVRHNVPAAAEELEKFYKGALGTDAIPLLVAVNIQGLVDGGEGDQFSLAIVRTKAEKAKESIVIDELLLGSGWQIPIEKGQWYLGVQYLQHVAQPGTDERFRLPPCTVIRSVPISALISPLLPLDAFSGITRATFLPCTNCNNSMSLHYIGQSLPCAPLHTPTTTTSTTSTTTTTMNNTTASFKIKNPIVARIAKERKVDTGSSYGWEEAVEQGQQQQQQVGFALFFSM
jgi:hypothetical protein